MSLASQLSFLKIVLTFAKVKELHLLEDNLLTKESKKRKKKSPAPGMIQTTTTLSIDYEECALPLCYNHCPEKTAFAGWRKIGRVKTKKRKNPLNHPGLPGTFHRRRTWPLRCWCWPCWRWTRGCRASAPAAARLHLETKRQRHSLICLYLKFTLNQHSTDPL